MSKNVLFSNLKTIFVYFLRLETKNWPYKHEIRSVGYYNFQLWNNKTENARTARTMTGRIGKGGNIETNL